MTIKAQRKRDKWSYTVIKFLYNIVIKLVLLYIVIIPKKIVKERQGSENGTIENIH